MVDCVIGGVILYRGTVTGKKQPIASRSNEQSEFWVMENTTCKLAWFLNLDIPML